MSFGRKGVAQGAVASAAGPAFGAAQAAPEPKPSSGPPSRRFRIKIKRAPYLMIMAVMAVAALVIASDVAKGGPPTIAYLRALPISAGAYMVIGPLMILGALALAWLVGSRVVFAPKSRQSLVLEANGLRGMKSIFSKEQTFIAYSDITRIEHLVNNKQRGFRIHGADGQKIAWDEMNFGDLNAYDDFHDALKQYAWRAGVDL